MNRTARHNRTAVAITAVLALFACLAFCACSIQPEEPADDTQMEVQTSPEGGTPLAEGRIVMTLLGSEETLVAQGENYIEPGCIAYDTQDGFLTGKVRTEGRVDVSKPGTSTITYSVRNSDGMEATCTRTVKVTDAMKKDTDGIPVLMYHYVYGDASEIPENDPSDGNNYLPVEKLEAQLKWLTKKHYYFPSYRELHAYIDGTHSLPAKSVILTFDDGADSFPEYVIPLLEKYKVPATSFVIGDRKRTKKLLKKHASPYVNYQSHSYGLHTGGTQENVGRGGIIYDFSAEELLEDAQRMQKMLGGYEAFAYPYGDVSDDAPAALEEAGTLCAFTVEYGQVKTGDDPMRLKRVRIYAESALEGFQAQVQGRG